MLHLIRENLVGYGVILGLEVLILASSVLLNRTGRVPREMNRKFVHVVGAGVLLLCPVLLTSHWAMLIVAIGASALLIITTAFEAFSGLHGVGRGVGGVATYPLAGWIVFYGAFGRGSEDWLAYVIPVLVLAAADAMGAIVGTRWGRHRYVVARDQVRSLEGSAVVAIVAFVVTLVPLLVSGALPLVNALLIAVYVGIIASALESVSVLGLDNVLVPFGALMSFQAIRGDSASTLAMQLLSMVAVSALVMLLMRGRVAHIGGPVAAGILLFVVMHAGGAAWSIPFGVLLGIWAVYDRLTRSSAQNRLRITSLTTVVTGFGAPTMLLASWMLIENAHVRLVLYAAYLTALAVPAGVLWLTMAQSRTFRYRRVMDRFACSDSSNRYRLTPGALVSAILAIACVMLAGRVYDPKTHAVLVAGVSALLGGICFSLLASRVSHRVTCATCGSIVLAGLDCCGTPGQRSGVQALDFSLTLALVNIMSVALVMVTLLALGS